MKRRAIFTNEKLYVKVYFHFKNVPIYARKRAEKEFMKNRGEVVKIFNALITEVNNEWDQTGEPTMFGDYIEDINPKYAKLIQDRIQPYVDMVNEFFPYCKYRIDEYGDIIGFIPKYKNSKISITLKVLESFN